MSPDGIGGLGRFVRPRGAGDDTPLPPGLKRFLETQAPPPDPWTSARIPGALPGEGSPLRKTQVTHGNRATFTPGKPALFASLSNSAKSGRGLTVDGPTSRA